MDHERKLIDTGQRMKSLTWSVSKVAEYLFCPCLNARLRLCMVQKFTDTEAYANESVFFWTT